LCLLVKAVEANVPPPGNIPLPIVKAVTNIVTSRLTSTSITHPSTFIPDGFTTNTPGPLKNVAPLVLETQTGPSEPSSIFTESLSTSTTAATTITQPDPSEIVKDPFTCTPAVITTNTPGPVPNVSATALAINTDVTTPDAAMTVLDPTNILPGETTTDTPPPLANLAPILMGDKTDLPAPSQDATALDLRLQSAKLKLNVALLHKKLKAAKARQLNMVLAGKIVDKQHPPIEHTNNPGVLEPTVSVNHQVICKREKHSYFT
jgi:hypothetical protein